MSEQQEAKQKSRESLRHGRNYRRQGQALKALKACDQAFAEYEQAIRSGERRDAKLLSDLHAQRGAAKAAVGFLTSRDLDQAHGQDAPAVDDVPGAIEDLERAVALNKYNGWAWAQLGEARRVLARDMYKLLSTEQFESCTRGAIEAFEQAAQLLPDETAWVNAHLAAAHFAHYWVALDAEAPPTAKRGHGRRPGKADKRTSKRDAHPDKETARALFRQAIDENPNYAWAKRFMAYLVTLDQEYDLGKELLGDALLDDPQARLHVLRSMSLLSLYSGSEGDDGKGRTAENRATALEEAIRAAGQVLTQDPEDYMAIYVHAAAVSELADVHDVDARYAEEVCRNACGKLVHVISRILGLTVGLYLRSGRNASAEQVGHDVLALLDRHLENAHRDHELHTIRRHEAFWSDRAALPGGPGNGAPTHFEVALDILRKLTETTRAARAQLTPEGNP
jgi:tetratricopeptide (TPR) repeat protein